MNLSSVGGGKKRKAPNTLYSSKGEETRTRKRKGGEEPYDPVLSRS